MCSVLVSVSVQKALERSGADSEINWTESAVFPTECELHLALKGTVMYTLVKVTAAVV